MQEMTIAKYIKQSGVTDGIKRETRKEKFASSLNLTERDINFILSDDFKEVAKLVGLVELLISREKKNDERCFELMYENAELKVAFELQQKELGKLKEKLKGF